MSPKTRAQKPHTPKAGPRARSPSEQFTLVGLNRKKRSYDIVKDHHEDKHGFLTLHFHSSEFKKLHSRLLEGARASFTSDAGGEDPKEGYIVEQAKAKVRQEIKDCLATTEKQTPLSFNDQKLHASERGILKTLPEDSEPAKHRIPRSELGEADFVAAEVYCTNGFKPAQSHIEAGVPLTNHTLDKVKQSKSKNLKRSRSPDSPSLLHSVPVHSSGETSPQSTVTSRRTSPSKAQESARKKSVGKGRKPNATATSKFLPTLARDRKIDALNKKKFPPGCPPDPPKMAPVRDPTDVSNKIKDVIQNLFDVQSQTHGFVPETQDLLIDKMAELTQSLSDLQRLTDKSLSPNNPVQDIDLAPEIVDYVDDGRNPDIFTRDFVELVQRGNAVVNGKKQAFQDFSVVYAKALKEGIGGVDRHVDAVMEAAGIEMGNQGNGEKKG